MRTVPLLAFAKRRRDAIHSNHAARTTGRYLSSEELRGQLVLETSSCRIRDAARASLGPAATGSRRCTSQAGSRRSRARSRSCSEPGMADPAGGTPRGSAIWPLTQGLHVLRRASRVTPQTARSAQEHLGPGAPLAPSVILIGHRWPGHDERHSFAAPCASGRSRVHRNDYVFFVVGRAVAMGRRQPCRLPRVP